MVNRKYNTSSLVIEPLSITRTAQDEEKDVSNRNIQVGDHCRLEHIDNKTKKILTQEHNSLRTLQLMLS